MKLNIQKRLTVLLLICSLSLSASTLSQTLHNSLESDILTITQDIQAFELEQREVQKNHIRLLQDSGVVVDNIDGLNALILTLKEEMKTEVESLGATLISDDVRVANRFKDLLQNAREARDWDLKREIQALKDCEDYFSQGKERIFRMQKDIAVEAVEEFWLLTPFEKGKILNQLLVVNENATRVLVGKNFEKWITKSDDEAHLTLLNAPVGMRIHPKSGWLTWRPTGNQAGNREVEIVETLDDVEIAHHKLNLFVPYREYTVEGLFVKLENLGDNTNIGDGSAENPFNSIKSACRALDGNLSSIFVRGGDYRDLLSETSVNECYGTATKNILIRPWGEEQVSIAFKDRAGIQIRNSSYVTLEGFEIIGANSKATFEDAMNNWWSDTDFYQGTGIAIREGSDHILVQKNIVHDTTASGIKAVGASAVTIKENIVYNCAWWTIQGTTGIGITLAKAYESDSDNSRAYNKMVRNLIFNNESRIYSRVWAKGEAHLRVDEGEAILVQEQNVGVTGGYKGRYLIQNNFLLHNGKTIVVNQAGRVDIRRNSYYMNGTTAKNKELYVAAGLRVNRSEDVTFRANAIDADSLHGLLYSVADNSADAFSQRGAISNNVGRGAYTAHGENEELVNGLTRTYETIFQNPTKGNFTIVTDINETAIGADMKIMQKHKKNLKRYAISFEKNNYVVDNQLMTQKVIDNIPTGATIDSTHYESEGYLIIKGLPRNHPFVKYQREHNQRVRGFKLFLEYGEELSF